MKKIKILFTLLCVLLLIAGVQTTKSFAEDEYVAKVYIETPQNSVFKDTLNIDGWLMSNDINAEIKVYVDGEEKEIQEIIRTEREDVINAIKGYGGIEENPKPGYSLKLSIKDIGDGIHNIEVRILSRNGNILDSKVITIVMEKYKAKTYIESPAQGTIVEDILQIDGWMMSDDEKAQIKMYVNGKERKIIQNNRFERQDVINAINGYGGRETNPNPGFSVKIDLSDLEHGLNEIILKIVSRNGEVLTSETISIQIEKTYKAKIYIDSPSDYNIVKPVMPIAGWIMTNDEQAQVNVYIDYTKQNLESFERTERQDVLNVINGYGNVELNPLPGFEAQLNLFQVTEGLHTLRIEVVSRDGNVLATDSRVINLEKYKARTYIESPAQGTIVKNTLQIDGWMMSDDEKAQIKIYANGKEIKIIQNNRFERQDVINAIKGYGGKEINPTPGFSLKLDLSDFEHGLNEIILKIVSRNGEVLETEAITIQMITYKAKIYIDNPSDNNIVKPIMPIAGWIMTNDEQAQVNVYIDYTKQNLESFERTEREDVLNAIKGYGNEEQNPLPGFEAQLNLFQVTEGLHTLRIEVVSRKGDILATDSRIINVEKYKARTYIESPTNGTIVENTLEIGGWLMSEDDSTQIRLLVDGIEQKNIKFDRTKRDDVIEAVKGFGNAEQNPLPGYNTQIDLSYLKDGKHVVTIEVISITGDVIAADIRNVEVDKYRADAGIELPVIMGQVKSELTVSGWLMTTDKEATINVYINDEKQTINKLERTERPDVINAIKGFGGIEENPLPGYVAQLDVSNFSDGKYILKVEVVSREGEVIYIGTRIFVIYNKYQSGIDVSSWNGNIDWSKVKEQGIEFAIIRAGFRGYGTEGTLVKDSTFVTNMKGALANGIEVGVYFYSQAITEAEAIQEAEMTLQIIQDNGFASDITFPIVIDTEASGGRGDTMTKEQRTAVVKAFCNRIAQAGYKPMIYSNKYWLYDNLNMNELSEYDVWMAHYTGTDDPANNPSDYNGSYQIWQYTSSGSVYGISGNVDMNICYKKYFK